MICALDEQTSLVACPECGKMLNPHIGLPTHRSRMHGVKGSAHGRRVRKPKAGRVSKIDLLPAMHVLVNTAMEIAELAEGAVAAGELVITSVQPLRSRYIKLRDRVRKLSDIAKRFHDDANED